LSKAGGHGANNGGGSRYRRPLRGNLEDVGILSRRTVLCRTTHFMAIPCYEQSDDFISQVSRSDPRASLARITSQVIPLDQSKERSEAA
jgi:hypothetical protein